MFRAQVLRRNLSLFNRVPHSHLVRSAARNNHENVTIQRFRIQRPVFSRSRLVGTLIVTLAFHGLIRYLEVEVDVQVVSEAERKSRPGGPNDEKAWPQVGQEVHDGDEEEAEEVDNALLFLPTGLPRPAPKTFYKGSDPEWQEFKRIAADKGRAEKIRVELVAMVRSLVASMPQWEAKIGKVDQTKGSAWVEVMFPDCPPNGYERPGIALTDELKWVKVVRPVEQEDHHRLHRILKPTGAANAVSQDVQRRASRFLKDFKAYFGWDEKTTATSVPLGLPPIPINILSPSSRAAASSDATPNPSATSSPPDTAHQSTTSASASPAPVGAPSSTLKFLLPDPKTLRMDLAHFRRDLAKGTKPSTLQSPRGSFYVKGIIEVHGSRARVTFNTTAVYDPKQGKYIAMNVGIFNFKEHRQSPKGGP